MTRQKALQNPVRVNLVVEEAFRDLLVDLQERIRAASVSEVVRRAVYAYAAKIRGREGAACKE